MFVKECKSGWREVCQGQLCLRLQLTGRILGSQEAEVFCYKKTTCSYTLQSRFEHFYSIIINYFTAGYIRKNINAHSFMVVSAAGTTIFQKIYFPSTFCHSLMNFRAFSFHPQLVFSWCSLFDLGVLFLTLVLL